MGKPVDGIVLVDKAEGESSYAVVKKMKRFARKVGHAGTLDPFATGLLIILLGQATKLSNFLMAGNKTYLAVMRLGVETDTFDPTGRIVATHPVPGITEEEIQKKARDFVGVIEQAPPPYSAVKVEGERAYKLARRGEEVRLEKRKITVHSLRVLSVELPDVMMEVRCSKGTYLRSLAADMGRSLGPGAHLTSLRRISSGPFSAEGALNSVEIPKSPPAMIGERVIPLREALPDMAEIRIDAPLAGKVRQGYQPSLAELTAEGGGSHSGHVKLVSDERLVALAGVEEAGGGEPSRVRIKRVFV